MRGNTCAALFTHFFTLATPTCSLLSASWRASLCCPMSHAQASFSTSTMRCHGWRAGSGKQKLLLAGQWLGDTPFAFTVASPHLGFSWSSLQIKCRNTKTLKGHSKTEVSPKTPRFLLLLITCIGSHNHSLGPQCPRHPEATPAPYALGPTEPRRAATERLSQPISSMTQNQRESCSSKLIKGLNAALLALSSALHHTLLTQSSPGRTKIYASKINPVLAGRWMI